MDDPKLLQHVITLAFVAMGLMASVIGWFLRKDYSRIEDQLKEEKKAREQELSNERTARAKDKHDLRDELATEVGARHALEVRIASDYVNTDRMEKALGQALGPLNESIKGFRDTLKLIFEKLDNKVDKGRG